MTEHWCSNSSRTAAGRISGSGRAPGHPFLWVNIETMEADRNDRFPETMKTAVMQWARPRQAELAEAWLKAKAGMKVGRIP